MPTLTMIRQIKVLTEDGPQTQTWRTRGGVVMQLEITRKSLAQFRH